MDLLEVVAQPTWREFLTDLVATEQMDPWDVDIADIADKYLQQVKKMQEMDLRVPANVILACALLLRFKADALNLDEAEEEGEAFTEEPLQHEELPDLVFKANRPRRRRVTLDELLNAVDEVMREGRRAASQKGAAPEVLRVELPERGMDERMREVLEKATGLKDADGVLLFSALFKEWHADAVADHLVPVMHLVQEDKVDAWQDEVFGDVFLKVLDEEDRREEKPESRASESHASKAARKEPGKPRRKRRRTKQPSKLLKGKK